MNQKLFKRRGGSRTLLLGRWAGIEIHLDLSWFLIVGFITYTLAGEFFPEFLQHQTRTVYYLMGACASLLFFFSLLLHELGHSVVSQRCGIPVPRITLYLIGGVAELAREPDDPRSELKIALGGPIVSAILVAVYFGLSALTEYLGWIAPSCVLFWLGWANLGLLLFNLIPGFPLDGGRVLRSLLWARSGKLHRSTWISSRIGIGLSWLLMTWGLYRITFAHQWTAMSLLLIGLFLRRAATDGYAHAVERSLLHGLQVRHLMPPNPILLDASLSIAQAIEKVFLPNHLKVCAVRDSNGAFRGLLQLKQISRLSPERRAQCMVEELVTPNTRDLNQIEVDESAARAWRLLKRSGYQMLAVVQLGELIGTLSRKDLQRAVSVRSALESSGPTRAIH